MTTPVVASSTTNASAGTSTSAIGNRPSGVADGDWLLAVVVSGGTTATTVSSPPSGWGSPVVNDIATGAFENRITAYLKIASSEPASWTWTLTAARDNTVHVVRITGADTSGVDAAASQVNGVSSSITAPSIAPAGSDDLLLGIFSRGGSSAATITPPGSMTGVTDSVTGTLNQRTIIAREDLSASGATGTRVATASTGAVNVGALIAIKAAAVAAAASLLMAFP